MNAPTDFDLTDAEGPAKALREIEARPRKSEEGLGATFDQVAVGLGFLTPDLEWTWVNRRLCQILGFSVEELLQRSCLEVVCPENLQELLEHKRQILAGEIESFALEQRCRRKDGSVFWASWMVSLGRRPGGEIEHLVAVVDDISVRKWTEGNLLRMRACIEGSSEGIAFADVEGHHTYHNRAYTRMFGYRVEEMAGPLAHLALCADQAVGRAVFDTVMQGQSWRGEVDMLAKNGRRFPVEVRADPIRDERGQLIGLIGVHTDITERNLARQALAQSEQRFRTLFEFAPDGIYLLDIQGNVVDGNKAAEDLIGYARQELIGKSVLTSNLLPPPDLLRATESLGRNAQRRPAGPEEFTLKRKDGRQITVEIRTFPVQIGNQPMVLGIARDTTERRQLEGQLRQAQKMEAVGQLAGGVAHDFNNMLAVIRGNADLVLMESGELSAEANECLNHIIGASERASNLTRQLLAFSREHVAQLQPVALNQLIRNLAKMLERTIREDIHLEYLYADPSPFVQADPAMLEQVLLNLVVNARDAMPQGGHLQIATKKLSLDAAHAPANPEAWAGESVCLSVSDTGTGIAQEHLQRIFEPFFTTKEPGKGSGLGLATVYGIVKQHQGRVEVASRVGEGTTFHIFLPAIAPPAKEAAALEAGAQLRGGAETILLVEDEYPVRMITRRVLETFGYKVHEAGSARDALEVWARHRQEFALLLTDIVMPDGGTGWDLAERLRAERPGLKIIFLSGYSPDLAGGKLDFIRRLNARFLRKPFSSRTILETTRRCLDENATPSSGAP
jgi:PAS domain S-box-containing protein